MRVVTWNMGCGPRVAQYRKTHDEAWDYLLQELRPDVVFVQEALVTKIEDARRNHSVSMCDLAAGVAAGTAVLVRNFDTAPAPAVSVSRDTYVVPAKVNTPAGPLTVVSVHIYPGKEQHADLGRLVALLDNTFSGQAILVGGDFNAARRFDEVYGGKMHGTFFSTMASAGLHEIHWAIHGREIQTFWGHQAKEAYQDDHFFIAKPWASRVRSCDVIDNEVVRRLSDHGPVVLELDVSAE
jgi:endonuclease/exonuclease/phosphatase family metal-dependent hydrolase